MRFTIERAVETATTEAFLPIYRESFAPLAELSAQKQLFSDDEFRSLMASTTTLKFCGWTEEDHGHRVLAALAVVATDLGLVPWLSEPFFAKVYPDEHARGALGCVMTILVGLPYRNQPWIVGLVQAIGAHTVAIEGVALFDCCKFNVEEAKFPELIASITRDWATLDARLLDYQNYYGFSAEPNKVIDLREFEQETAIDLRVQPVTAENPA